MKKQVFDYIICGGGASGLLLVNALLEDRYFDNKRILLIERETKNSNDRTWCFWETNPGHFDFLVKKSWPKASFKSKELNLNFKLAPFHYKMLRSKAFYNEIYQKMESHKQLTLLKAEVLNIKENQSTTRVKTDKGTFESEKVFNSIFNPKALCEQKKYPVLNQHFIGWFIKTNTPTFDPEKVLFMDFDILQEDQTRFLYLLPTDEKHALVEYTLFSEGLLQKEEYEKGIMDYLNAQGISAFEIEEKEQGNIPMSCFPFEQFNTPSLLNIGTAGGWTKASTGFTFKNTERKINRLVSFLKTEKNLNQFQTKNRFRFYDLLFLDVLLKYNEQGSKLFERMFAKNHPVTIFRFLDEKTTFLEDLKILSSFSLQQIRWFLSALVKRIF
ncbi:MAG: lycopene cyclase family protein [Flavobacteriaceae bacterium]|nr:lycopene cyclase family protein [Flavobacteriaceae bacterium]MDG1911207.1 lycopene cyclase family protein [Flavobacteriaceae bacterium]